MKPIPIRIPRVPQLPELTDCLAAQIAPDHRPARGHSARVAKPSASDEQQGSAVAPRQRGLRSGDDLSFSAPAGKSSAWLNALIWATVWRGMSWWARRRRASSPFDLPELRRSGGDRRLLSESLGGGDRAPQRLYRRDASAGVLRGLPALPLNNPVTKEAVDRKLTSII